MSATDLFISEIIEGSSYNKAVEIFNGTGAAVDLSQYTLELYSNGAGTPSQSVTLSGTLADGDVFVVANAAADGAILGVADLISSAVANFNGDDAIVLRRNGAVVDSFGTIGTDPGSEWPGGGQNDTLIRNPSVLMGDTDATDAFDASAEWQVRAQDDFSDLGSHTFGGGPAPSGIVISEVDADQTGTDAAEFVELFDGGAGNISLDGLTLVLFNGNGDVAYDAISLDGYTTNANGYFVIGSANVPNVDLIAFTTNGLQNGADAVALYQGAAPASGDPVTAANLVDAVVYGTSDPDATGLLAGLGEAVQWDEGANGLATTQSLVRQSDGSFVAGTPNPGGPQPPPPATITLISEIQGGVGTGPGAVVGIDDVSPLAGQTVTVQAVVSADFQDGLAGTLGDLNGFYVQEELVDWDASSLTSEGIFVFDGTAPSVDVQAGDLVEITGTVGEYFGQTQLTALSVQIVQSGLTPPTAIDVTFPTASVMQDASGGWVANLEAYEGMLVNVPQAMTVTEMFNLDRFGEYRISDERHVQFTQDNLPDPSGYAQHLKDVAAGSLVLDDGFTFQNPDPIRIIDGNDGVLTAADSFRMGDLLSGVTGALGYSFDEFRIHNGAGTFDKANPRPDAPQDVGGNFKVASLNVLNYFTTIDLSGVTTDIGADPRGADSDAEFQRQAAKIVEAIVTIDADVLGLVEIENDFAGTDFAVKDLVARLNADVGADVYAFVDPGQEFVGTDAIANALIYRKDRVATTGDMAILTDFEGRNFLDPLDAGRDLNRAAIAQTFTDLETGRSLLVSVNHLKSKGSLSGLPEDDAQGDGQGNNNATRTAAAGILADWLASDPTGQGADKQMILGDLNAYAMEDPIRLLESRGFTDLARADDPDAYSYVFDGQIGTLDYALGNAAVTSRVTGATEWHINADEADALDYNLDFGRNPNLYTSNPTRYSDHDPVIVGLDLLYLIMGTARRDVLIGSAAGDEILGKRGNDLIIAGKGDDLAFGGAGNDKVFGGAGDDTLILGPGVDFGFGGRGDDVIVFGQGRFDGVQGGSGSDTFVLALGSEADGVRSRTIVHDYDAAEDGLDLTGVEIAHVRETRHQVILTLDGDGDRVHLVGVDSFDRIVFADDTPIG